MAKIVEAVGTASAAKAGLGKKIEEAMGAAAVRAMAEGILDPDEIRERKLAARAAVKQAAADAAAAEAKK